MRNYKLWNHWIAEVRDIAVANECYFQDEEDSEGKPRYMTKTSVKYVFDKSLMGEYFKDRLSPQEAFELETSNWDGNLTTKGTLTFKDMETEIKKYVAQFTTSEQYTECDWKKIRPTLDINEDTTIGQIRKWMEQTGATRINEFIVIKIDTLPTHERN